jgi:hypothetical protein
MAAGLEDPTSTRTPPWVPAPLRSARALSGRPDGPPMLFAHGFGCESTLVPDATVSVNGYRFDTSRSNGSTPRSASC